MSKDADMLQEQYWKQQYQLLVTQYKLLEERLRQKGEELLEAQKYSESVSKAYEAAKYFHETMYIDCVARLRAVGMSDQSVSEFMAYWRDIRDNFVRDLIEDELEEEIKRKWIEAVRFLASRQVSTSGKKEF